MRKKSTFFVNTRRRILAGMATIVPIGLTFFILRIVFRFIYNFADKLFFNVLHKIALWEVAPSFVTKLSDYFESHKFVQTTIGVVLTITVLYVIGLFSNKIVVRKWIGLGESIVLRIPFIKTLYMASKQVIATFFVPSDHTPFKRVVLIDYPMEGTKALAFTTGKSVLRKDGQTYTNVFVPTTPNPTSGFMLMLPEEKITTLDISIEEGIKFVVSAGIIVPEKLSIDSFSVKNEKTNA